MKIILKKIINKIRQKRFYSVFGGREWHILQNQNGQILLLLDKIWTQRPYPDTPHA